MGLLVACGDTRPPARRPRQQSQKDPTQAALTSQHAAPTKSHQTVLHRRKFPLQHAGDPAGQEKILAEDRSPICRSKG
jgi:hypothetical protein